MHSLVFHSRRAQIDHTFCLVDSCTEEVWNTQVPQSKTCGNIIKEKAEELIAAATRAADYKRGWFSHSIMVEACNHAATLGTQHEEKCGPCSSDKLGDDYRALNAAADA